jgi:hypothetical protein
LSLSVLLSQLENYILKEIIRKINLFYIQHNQIISKKGDISTSFFIIQSGTVSYYEGE